MATYAIGDVQGCMSELAALLETCGFRADHDRLWFVGDLVNRGPASLEVLRFVKGLGDSAQVVLGNHDIHLLCIAEGVVKSRPDDTFEAVLAAPDRAGLLEWLRTRPLMIAEERVAMVHAGVLPQWTIAKALDLAHEVETMLRSAGYRQFLGQLYGSDPTAWSDSLAEPDRSRVIVNAMTRMRFCTAGGDMEFRSKGGLEGAPPGYRAWFDVPGRRSAETTIVCGHWSALGLRIEPRLLALDSGCVWGGALSAVRLEDRRLFQVPCGRHGSPVHA